MDIEFHYYITYLIAARAGFSSNDASIIAYSAQYIDDNDTIFEINKDKPSYYSNYISQTLDILKPKDKLFRIYPIFHFIPGDPMYLGARRKDGKLHFLNTTPGSDNANTILKKAISSNNLYRIGICCHSYEDTWAHQNFTGYFDDFNAMKGLFEKAIPKIGHAGALNKPDWPALIWYDCRLISPFEKVDNKARFLEAAVSLFEKLRKYVLPNCTESTIKKDSIELARDISEAIGSNDQTNRFRNARIDNYKKLSERPEYGGRKLQDYDEYKWMDDAVNEDVRGIQDRKRFFLLKFLPPNDVYTWKDTQNYTKTHWFKFQEAIKEQQKAASNVLYTSVFSKMELLRW